MRYDDLPDSLKEYLVEDGLAVNSYFAGLGGGHFSDVLAGGEYASSVSSVPYCKNIGIRGLLGVVDAAPGADVFDMLGGSGQIVLAAREYGLCGFTDAIITADIEIDQVERALRRGFRAILLDARDPHIIRTSSVQNLLYAYGFHHLSPDERNCRQGGAQNPEARGTAVFYEGTIGSTTERISSLVVDRLSNHPHKYPHPAIEQIVSAVRVAGMELRATFRILDPQIFLSASVDQARLVAARYYAGHYTVNSLSWDLLLDHLTDAYRSSSPIGEPLATADWQNLADLLPWNEAYSGPASIELLRAAFPRGWGTADESWQECVVIPREGVAVVCSEPG